MSFSIARLHALPDDELFRLHDAVAENTFVGVDYYLDEVRRREQAAVMRSNERLAKASLKLGAANTLLAAVAAVAAVVALLN